MPVTFEHAGPALLFAALAAAAARGMSRTKIVALAAATGLLALVPYGGISIAAFALALPGTLSAATLVLSAQLLLGALKAHVPHQPSGAFLASLILCGIVLYAPAAGIFVFDVYDLGFRGPAVPLLMAAFVFAGWLARSSDVAIWIALSALLYVVGAGSSMNLWDYLVDPVAWVAAAVTLLTRTAFSRDYRPVKAENSDTTRS